MKINNARKTKNLAKVNVKPKDMSEVHCLLKEYFEKSLEKLIDKLQTVTNEKLLDQMKEVQKLNSRIGKI
jgi:hypothetical protein